MNRKVKKPTETLTESNCIHVLRYLLCRHEHDVCKL